MARWGSMPFVVSGALGLVVVIGFVGISHHNQTPSILLLGDSVYWLEVNKKNVYEELETGIKWLKQRQFVPRQIIMEQKEVVARLARMPLEPNLRNRLLASRGILIDCSPSTEAREKETRAP